MPLGRNPLDVRCRLGRQYRSFRPSSMPYTTYAADFDGTNDYLNRNTPSGVSDGKTGIFSCWYKKEGGDGTARRLLHANNLRSSVLVEHRTTNGIRLEFRDSSNFVAIRLDSSINLTGSGWYHLLASWDAANTVGHLYINDVNRLGSTILSNRLIEYNRGPYTVGSGYLGVFKTNGCLSEMYFNCDTYMDLSVESNRRKFISNTGKAIFLGDTGAIPTGSQPAIYLKENYDSFETNAGYLGNFTVTGALAACSSTPND